MICIRSPLRSRLCKQYEFGLFNHLPCWILIVTNIFSHSSPYVFLCNLYPFNSKVTKTELRNQSGAKLVLGEGRQKMKMQDWSSTLTIRCLVSEPASNMWYTEIHFIFTKCHVCIANKSQVPGFPRSWTSCDLLTLTSKMVTADL